MKKIIILFCLLILTGCTYKEEISGEITEIKYNDLTIIKDDYQKIKNLINTSYSCDKPDESLEDKLTIKTKEDIYYYTLSDNYISIHNHYSKNTSLNEYLKELESKYNNTDFYKIDYQKNVNKEALNIELDKTSNYIIISLEEEIKNFKINQIEYENGEYTDIDLLYSNENISDNVITIRKSINYGNPDIKISFENPYNYLVTIIPTYTDGKIHFETYYKQN